MFSSKRKASIKAWPKKSCLEKSHVMHPFAIAPFSGIGLSCLTAVRIITLAASANTVKLSVESSLLNRMMLSENCANCNSESLYCSIYKLISLIKAVNWLNKSSCPVRATRSLKPMISKKATKRSAVSLYSFCEEGALCPSVIMACGSISIPIALIFSQQSWDLRHSNIQWCCLCFLRKHRHAYLLPKRISPLSEPRKNLWQCGISTKQCP